MKKIYKVIVFCTFSSCSIGPDYKNPELDLPKKFDTDSLTQIQNNKFSENKPGLWWKYFNDKKLEQLINIAAVDNLKIQEALARIEQAEALRKDAFNNFFPIPNLEGQYIKNKTAAARFPGIARNGIEFEIFSASTSVSWEIDVFGRLRRAYEAANYREAESIYNTLTTISSIHAQIATAYFQYLGALKQKQIASQNAINQEKVLDIMQKKHDIGVISAYDLELTRSQTMKTKSLVSSYDYLASSALNRLSALIGRFPKDVPSILLDENNNESIPSYNGPLTIGEPLELIKRRPDIRAAEEQLKAASAEIGVAMGDLYPKISFFGSLSREARNVSDLSTSSANAYNYGPSISWSILNLNAIINRIDSSKYNEKAFLFNYKNTVVLALEEVDNSLKNINQLLSKTYLLKISAESSKKAHEIATLKFEVGSINIVDFLVSQNQALTNDSEYTNSLIDLNLAYITLFRALGGAWEDTNNS